MHWLRTRTITTALLSAALMCEHASAQDVQGSPYSSYGLGDMVGTPQVAQAAMGGTGVAVVDEFGMVGGNPAAYPWLKRPVFNIGGVWRRTTASNGTVKQVRSDAKLLGFDLGVPFGKGRMAIALGLRPVSSTGYQVNQTAAISTGESVRFLYAGAGGLNRAYAGFGATVSQRVDTLKNTERLSLGVDVNYLFGDIEQTRKTYYPLGVGYYNTFAFNALNLGSDFSPPSLRFGAIWQGTLDRRRSKDDTGWWEYLVGATMEHGARMNATITDLTTSFTLVNGVESLKDTVAPLTETAGSIRLPDAFGLGITLRSAVWSLTAEARMRDWSAYEMDVPGYASPASLGSSTTVALGASFHAAGAGSASGFLQRAWWRMGLRLTDDYLIVNGAQLNDRAISAGVSLPLLGSLSRTRLDLGFEYGQRGEEDLLQERYMNVFFGISYTPFGERWFERRRLE